MKKKKILAYLFLISLFSLVSCNNDSTSQSTTSNQNTTTTTTSEDNLPNQFTISVNGENENGIDDNNLSTSDGLEVKILNANKLNVSNNEISLNKNGELVLSLTKQYKISSVILSGYTQDIGKTSNIEVSYDGISYEKQIDSNGGSTSFDFDFLAYTDNLSIKNLSDNDFKLDAIFLNLSKDNLVNATSFTKTINDDVIEFSNAKAFDLTSLYEISPLNTSSRKISVSVDKDSYEIVNNKIIFDEAGTYQITINLVNTNFNLTYKFDCSCLYKLSEDEIKFSSYDVNKYSHTNSLKSVGDQKVLVVPVQFDAQYYYGYETSPYSDYYLDLMQQAFTNDADTGDLNWESLRSYYEKSSFGKLNLDFVFSDIYEPEMKFSEFMSFEMGIGSSLLLSEIHENLTINNTSVDFKDFDLDEDGYVDAVWLIYNVFDQIYTNQVPLWAFKSVNFVEANKDDPVFNDYANCAFSFMTENGYLDAHTLIHETGHILGLNDYYNNDYVSPLGACDMMSYTLGDHNVYSKYLLNWIEPYVFTGEGSVTLKPSNETGDALIIPASDEFSNSPYDEYLMIEFYTPENLEYNDAIQGVPGYGRKFNNYGLRVYHIDARLFIVNINITNGSFGFDYTNPQYFDINNSDELLYNKVEGQENIYEIAFHLNSNSNIYNEYFGRKVTNYEIETITRNNKSLLSGYVEGNEVLWKKGDNINKNTASNFFKNGLFHNGYEFNYNIEISSMSEDEVELNISLLD